jgi:hypothetical protein
MLLEFLHNNLVGDTPTSAVVVVAGQRIYNGARCMRVLVVITPTRAVVVVAGQRLYNGARCMRVLLVITPTRG